MQSILRSKMKHVTVMPFLLLLFGAPMLAQMDCHFTIIEEFDTKETDEFVEFVFGDGEAKKHRNRIINKKIGGDTLKLHLAVKSHEIGELFSSAEMGNDTLYLQFRVRPEVMEGYERVEIASYFTYREIEMTVAGLQRMPAVIFLNGEEIEQTDEVYLTFPEKYELDGEDTINRIDKYGQKQGVWIGYYGNQVHESLFRDSKMLQCLRMSFYPSGKLKAEDIIVPDARQNTVSFRAYFESGAVAEENYRIGKTGIYKVRWHPNGIKSQENHFDGELIHISQFDETGIIECKCKTEIGVVELNGQHAHWTTNEFDIPCTLYDREGNMTGEKEKKFKLRYDILPGK